MKRNVWYTLLMSVLALISQSCAPFSPDTGEKEIRASIDNYKQVYQNGDDRGKSPTADDYGLNLAIVIWTSPGTITPNSNTQSHNKRGKAANNLYANADPSFVPLTPKADSSYSFLEHIRFFTGLEYIKKRTKDGGGKVNMDYLEIPAQAFYFYDLPKEKGSVYAGLGPYLAYGIAGKTKTSYGGIKEKVKSFDKNDGFKRFDAGIVASVGYKMPQSFSFTLSYEWGLANISRQEANPVLGDIKVKNRMLSLNVGYPISQLLPKK